MKACWVLFIVAFVGLDLYAVFYGRLTFSHFIWELICDFPRLYFAVAFVLGFIVYHFWWWWK